MSYNQTRRSETSFTTPTIPKPPSTTLNPLESRIEKLRTSPNNAHRIDTSRLRAETIPLPDELLVNEILPRLTLADLVAYCVTNPAAAILCEREGLIGKKLDQINELGYCSLQKLTLSWACSGDRLEQYMRLLPSIIRRLDLHTINLVYLYFLEQRFYTEAQIVKTLGTPLITSDIMIIGEMSFFRPYPDDYKNVEMFLDSMKNGDESKASYYFIQAFKAFTSESMPSAVDKKYFADLIGRTLTNEELLPFLRSLKQIEWKSGLESFSVYFYYYLYRTKRLTRELVRNSPFSNPLLLRNVIRRTEWPFYGIENIKHNNKNDRFAPTPVFLSLESLIREVLARRANTPFLLLSPEEYVTLITTHCSKTKLLEAVSNSVYTAAQYSGYNAWIDDVYCILGKRDYAYSLTWGWYEKNP